MTRLPLNDQLQSFFRNKPISLHVPGHKNMTIGDLDQIEGYMDITEITGFDDLHEAEAILKESMKTLEKHSDYEAVFLVNGTTSGILSVIQAFSSGEGVYVMTRNMHKSVFNALDLSHQRAHILPMCQSRVTSQYQGPQPASCAKINDFKQAKLGIFTYPNYYGETFDIRSWIDHLHQLDVPVLIDEAHGAHFDLEGFPESTLNMGADYVVQSFHKSLPAFTMSSVIYIHKDAKLRHEVKRYLTQFQSSSPSYLLMAGLERAAQFYHHYDSGIFFEKRAKLIGLLKGKGFDVREVDDPLKLVVRYPNVTGYDVKRLFEESHIYVELDDMYQVLLVLPLWHEGDRFNFELLSQRIQAFDTSRLEPAQLQATELYLDGGAYYSERFKTLEMPYQDAVGCVLGQHIMPYPPGIPILFKGEIITQDMIKLIRHWLSFDVRIEGLHDGKIKVKE
ncbi:lysine decarboxylase [Staphylococcus massiliensis]|uniref:lysine decarboxylase n=1 Tax=Staphylococcus massiliensis TaxID=555791 RepID=UPI001EDFCF0A|nr:lysine decarboxylase [Staphylococcus massiliensis]MCG3413221.1 lysine decarboxylase [Staphylococcus massiliensis]